MAKKRQRETVVSVAPDGPDGEEKEKREDEEQEQEEDHMKALEDEVFGDLYGKSSVVLSKEILNKKDAFKDMVRDDEGQPLFMIDKNDAPRSSDTAPKGKLTVAWQDQDDDQINIDISKVNRLKKLKKTQIETLVSGTEYSKRLRKQHELITGVAEKSWAVIPQDVTMDETDELLASNVNSVKKKAMLPGNKLDIKRMKNANRQGISNCVIQAINWHQNSQLFLTGGMDKTLRLFNIDGDKNNKIQSIFFPDLPIMSAKFINQDHSEIICSGRRPFYYSFDIHSGVIKKIPKIIGRTEKSMESFDASADGKYLAFVGNDGYIIVVSQKSKKWIFNLKINHQVRCIKFSKDSKYLYCGSSSGEFYKFDLGQRRCVNRHRDEGSTCIRSFDISNSGETYSIGSVNGVVNVYNAYQASQSNNPSPLKSIMNLTTAIDDIKYNHDDQLLCLLSSRKKESLKLLHLDSMNVISNWPTKRTPVSYASTCEFSPNSGYFTVGNDKGITLLYRLNYYQST